MGVICNPVPLAVSAFPRHCVDVSRGLRSRRHSHVARGRAGWSRYGTANHCLRTDVGAGQPAAGDSGNFRTYLSVRSFVPESAVFSQQHSGSAFEVESARATVVAGFSALLAIVIWGDGPK